MYCMNCGKEVPEDADICLSCNNPPLLMDKYCYECGNPISQKQKICNDCGAPLTLEQERIKKSDVYPKLYRSSDEGIIIGFFAGLGHKFDVNPWFLRIICILFFPLMIWIYFLTLLLPVCPTRTNSFKRTLK
jgi:phage shock protein PspC (stress-responsive transcriptional regulator)